MGYIITEIVEAESRKEAIRKIKSGEFHPLYALSRYGKFRASKVKKPN